MIEIQNVTTLDGEVKTLHLESSTRHVIDAKGLLLFPALIDPHVHFRTPGLEHKENWISGARAAIHGGITTVFDMPNTLPSTITKMRLDEKYSLIDQQLKMAQIPLRYRLFLGADKNHFQEIARCRDQIIGLKIFMGSSTGDLLMDDESSLHAAFSLAHKFDLLVAVHAEDEEEIQKRKSACQDFSSVHVHSEIRHRRAAWIATKKAIELAKLYKTRLYLLHISTKEELELIEAAKEEGLNVFAETTPHHLFLTEKDYAVWGTKVQMNPPLRAQEDTIALWEGIKKGVIDCIGSDHAPHTLEEKAKEYGKAPSGIPGVETTLPLLLNAASLGKITLPRIIELMKTNIETIFRLPKNDDLLLIDIDRIKSVEERELKTKCGWSPYAGKSLKGWPTHVIMKGHLYALS